ncbi:MAG: phosphotransferase [Bacteroidota bacterium]
MKVEYSQVSPEALKDLLVERYDLPPSTVVLFLHQGLNDTYLITTAAKKYILRVYRKDWKPYEDILGELELIDLLTEAKILVASPIPDRENKRIQQLPAPEGTRYAVVFNFAPGKALPALDEENAQLFGQHLALVHHVTAGTQMDNLSKSYDVAGILSFTKSCLVGRLGTAHSSLQLLAQIEEGLLTQLSPDILKALPQGVCHGDPHYENCFLAPNMQELTFFDFDFCGNGYLHYDLGSFMHYERANPLIQESFLAGYTEKRPLSDLQLSAIPYFTILMRLFHLGARAKNADGTKNPIWPADGIESTAQNILAQLTALNNQG